MFVIVQGFHCVVFRGHRHRQRESKVALLFSLWSKRYPGKICIFVLLILKVKCYLLLWNWSLPAVCFWQENFGIAHLAGMSCVVDGTIPPSSGLSSSSALVCCAGLVTVEANQKSLSKVKCFTIEAFHFKTLYIYFHIGKSGKVLLNFL